MKKSKTTSVRIIGVPAKISKLPSPNINKKCTAGMKNIRIFWKIG
jgi:hypothetical protein